jgi:hypothetical protein
MSKNENITYVITMLIAAMMLGVLGALVVKRENLRKQQQYDYQR